MKGQIQFGESLMVVIVLVLILTIGMVFYFNVSKGAIKEEVRYREDAQAVTLAKNVLSTPEIKCGRLAGRGDACIDGAKLDALAWLIENDPSVKAYYASVFEYATIRVHRLTSAGFPVSDPDGTVFYDEPLDEAVFARQFIFTTLYDPVNDVQDLAYLNVTRYSRAIS